MSSASKPSPLDLLQASASELAVDGRRRWQVPDDWQQGKGAYGGLTIAAMVRAMTASESERLETQPLRTLSATLAAPVMVGAATISTEVLRRGGQTTVMSARIEQAGEVLATVTGFFGARRVEDGDWQDRDAPSMQDWRALPVAPLGPPFAPVFTKHFEFRLTGPLPFSGASAREASGWVRPKRPGAARDAAHLAALADVWWPSLLSTATAPRFASTVAFTLEVFGDWEGLDPDAPLFHHGVSTSARDGFAQDSRTLWGEDGRLMAVNHQIFAM